VDRSKVDKKRRRSGGAQIMRAPFDRVIIGGISGLLVDAGNNYLPPPGPGSEEKNRPGVQYDPAATAIARGAASSAAPDPNTRPQFVSRSDARVPRRMPRPALPIRLEEDYAKKILRVVKVMRAAYAPVIRQAPEMLRAIEHGDRMDAAADKVRSMLDAAKAAMEKAIQPRSLDAMIREHARQVGSFQAHQLRSQIREAAQVDPIFKDRGWDSRVDHFAARNASLIKSIPERLHGEVSELVLGAMQSGRLAGGRGRDPDTLRDDLEDRFGVSESRARLIARDQTTKFYSAVNHARQRELGVERFVWRTVGDERVRDEHDELEGQIFDYDDPPEVGMPGDDVQCRCYAEPVLDDLFDDDDSDEDEDSE
jgi:SPP1 gp7 family putative phage head morphogenesis protein